MTIASPEVTRGASELADKRGSRWTFLHRSVLSPVAIIAAHAALDLFFTPIARPLSDLSALGFMCAGATFGAIFSQPMIMAGAAVLAPARTVPRFLVTLLLAVLLAYAAVVGERWNNANLGAQANALVVFLVAFIVVQPAVWLVQRWRRWQVVSNRAACSAAPKGQFSVRQLLIAMTAACVVLALGTWVVPRDRWPNGWSETVASYHGAAELALIAAAVTAPAIPFIPLVLGSWRRGWIVAMSLWLLAALAVALPLVQVEPPQPPPANNPVMMYAPIILGGYGSVIVTLCLLRLCGFRLVRGTAFESAREPATER